MPPARPGPLLLWLFALLILAVGVVLGGGCSRKSEPKITGSRAGGQVNLACAWQPGQAYLLRFETEILTSADTFDRRSPDVHRVTYAQECLVRVTNAPRGDNLNLDMEILSVEMERAKGEAPALSFNSEQGGEIIDEHGYIPVLKKLVGGRLRFTVSPNGRVTNTIGLGEWLDRALGAETGVPAPPPVRLAKTVARPVPLAPDGPPPNVTLEEITVLPPGPPANPPALSGANATNMVRKAARMVTTRTSSSSSGGDNVGRTLRSFFTVDLFRMFLEFHFIPPNPVSVGDEWKESGDTPITTRSRVSYNAACKFAGWQMHGGTNCARIDAHGKTETKAPPARPTATAGGTKPAKGGGDYQSGLDGTVWINRELAFPATTLLDKEGMFSGDSTTTRMDGTNRVTITGAPKFVRQTVAITLLKVTPLDAPSDELKSEK